jgi:hypothetical protein
LFSDSSLISEKIDLDFDYNLSFIINEIDAGFDDEF